jgi:hypothetical protein
MSRTTETLVFTIVLPMIVLPMIVLPMIVLPMIVLANAILQGQDARFSMPFHYHKYSRLKLDGHGC